MLMKTDDLGIPRFSNQDLIDMIYTGDIEKCHVVLCDESEDINLFNKAAEKYGMSPLTKYIPLDVNKQQFDDVLQSQWFMPDEYKNMDIFSWLEQKCFSNESLERVEMEYKEYQKRGMVELLCYMVYLVDYMRKNGIVWGVGRGSSVASYILYLIGVHKIDSIQYGLDFHEFMR